MIYQKNWIFFENLFPDKTLKNTKKSNFQVKRMKNSQPYLCKSLFSICKRQFIHSIGPFFSLNLSACEFCSLCNWIGSAQSNKSQWWAWAYNTSENILIYILWYHVLKIQQNNEIKRKNKTKTNACNFMPTKRNEIKTKLPATEMCVCVEFYCGWLYDFIWYNYTIYEHWNYLQLVYEPWIAKNFIFN